MTKLVSGWLGGWVDLVGGWVGGWVGKRDVLALEEGVLIGGDGTLFETLAGEWSVLLWWVGGWVGGLVDCFKRVGGWMGCSLFYSSLYSTLVCIGENVGWESYAARERERCACGDRGERRRRRHWRENVLNELS